MLTIRDEEQDPAEGIHASDEQGVREKRGIAEKKRAYECVVRDTLHAATGLNMVPRGKSVEAEARKALTSD